MKKYLLVLLGFEIFSFSLSVQAQSLKTSMPESTKAALTAINSNQANQNGFTELSQIGVDSNNMANMAIPDVNSTYREAEARMTNKALYDNIKNNPIDLADPTKPPPNLRNNQKIMANANRINDGGNYGGVSNNMSGNTGFSSANNSQTVSFKKPGQTQQSGKGAAVITNDIGVYNKSTISEFENLGKTRAEGNYQKFLSEK